MSVEQRISSKGKKYWLARVFVGRKPDGTPIYKSKSCKTKAAATEHDERYKNFKNNVTNDRTVSDKTMVSVVWEAYLKELSEQMKDNTIISYKSRYKKWIEPELGMFQIGNINLLTVSRFKHNIEDRGASPSLVSYCLIVLKSLLEFASSGTQKYIISNPMKDYNIQSQAVDQTQTKVKFYKLEEAIKFFEHAKGTTFYTFMIFIANTGMRISEAAALRPSDFDFTTGIVTVNHNLSLYSPKRNEAEFDIATRVLSSPKSHERRVIALSPMAIQAAKAALQANPGSYFVFVGASKDKRKVIVKRGSKPVIVETPYLLVRSVYDHVKMISERAELPNIGPHGLRHTFAANYLMNGGSIHTLSKLLGHKSIKSTEIYSHLSFEFLKASASIVNFGGNLEE